MQRKKADFYVIGTGKNNSVEYFVKKCFEHVGLNYKKHAEETGNPIPTKPILFPRWPESHVGHAQPILLPRESAFLDYEGELAVIIGKQGRRIKEEKAYDFVAGYSCYNEGSVRDWQRRSSPVSYTHLTLPTNREV